MVLKSSVNQYLLFPYTQKNITYCGGKLQPILQNHMIIVFYLELRTFRE
jgi:hypothetical protein